LFHCYAEETGIPSTHPSNHDKPGNSFYSSQIYTHFIHQLLFLHIPHVAYAVRKSILQVFPYIAKFLVIFFLCLKFRNFRSKFSLCSYIFEVGLTTVGIKWNIRWTWNKTLIIIVLPNQISLINILINLYVSCLSGIFGQMPHVALPVAAFLEMLTKPVTTRTTTATALDVFGVGWVIKRPWEDDPRPNILQMNTEGLTAKKISIAEQLAYKNKDFIIVLQETHCTTADKLVVPDFSLAGSVLSRNHGFATFVHERLELSLVGQSPEQSETEWLCVDVACVTLPRRAWSGLTASATVSGVFAPVCTNGVWSPLRPVSVAQKNKPSTMLSSGVQSIDFLMNCTAWWFWKMRKLNGCSTPAPRSSSAKQLLEELAKIKKNVYSKSSKI